MSERLRDGRKNLAGKMQRALIVLIVCLAGYLIYKVWGGELFHRMRYETETEAVTSLPEKIEESGKTGTDVLPHTMMPGRRDAPLR